MKPNLDRTFWLLPALVLCLAVLAFVMLFQGDRPKLEESTETGQFAATPASQPDLPPREAAAAAPVGQSQARESLEPGGIPFSGIVVNRLSGEPVTDFDVSLARREAATEGLEAETWTPVLRDRVEDAEGRFAFRLEGGGMFSFYVQARGYLSHQYYELFIPPETGLREHRVELDPGAAVSGRVVDDRTGAPVLNAQVLREEPRRGIFMGIDEKHQPVARTNADGRFQLTGLPQASGEMRILAAHPDFALGWAVAENGDDGVEIRLKSGPRVFGTVRDDDGELIAGIRIYAVGETNPVVRPVTTDAGGRYQTHPLNPGDLAVTARVKGGEEWWVAAQAAGFTAETKEADLRGDDVQIDFGPSPEYVTWKGVLRGAGGEPSPDTTILVAQPPTPGRYRRNQMVGATTDGEGRFVFHKLRPGTFFVNLRWPATSSETQLEAVSLNAPGVVEQDLFVPGGCIRGVVVDEDGAPISGGAVGARRAWDPGQTSGGSFGDRQCIVSKEGTFCLTGLREGRYSLRYVGGGQSSDFPAMQDLVLFPPSSDWSHEVAEGEAVDGVRLVIPNRGTLKLRVAGCQAADKDRIWAELAKEPLDPSGRDRGRIPLGSLEGPGNLSVPLKVGTWHVAIVRDNGPPVERVAEVVRDRVTEIVVDRSELGPIEVPLTLQGVLERAGGAPVPGRALRLQKLRDGKPEKERIDFTTDSRGAFECAAATGRWSVSVSCGDPGTGSGHSSVVLPDLQIPEGSADPYFVRLVLPSGRVTCKVDAAPFKAAAGVEELQWSIFLVDSEGRDIATSFSLRGAEAVLDDIPPGEYRLRVDMNRALPWLSNPFTVRDGETSEVAFAPLPAGLLDLEVTDVENRPVEPNIDVIATGIHAGRTLFPHRTRGGRIECPFPAGSATALIRAEGFKDAPISATLEPNEVKELRVVLEREAAAEPGG